MYYILNLTIFLWYESVTELILEYFVALIRLNMQITIALSSLVQGILIMCVIIHVCNDNIKVIIMDIMKEIALYLL